jgi:hypothetical protein
MNTVCADCEPDIGVLLAVCRRHIGFTRNADAAERR